MSTETAAQVRRVQTGTVWVDSGMVMVVDPCYVLRDKWGEEHGLKKSFDSSETNYWKAIEHCHNSSPSFRIVKQDGDKIVIDPTPIPITDAEPLSNEEHRQIAYGTVCDTVKGDGTYPVYAVYVGDSLVGLEVRFDE